MTGDRATFLVREVKDLNEPHSDDESNNHPEQPPENIPVILKDFKGKKFELEVHLNKRRTDQ
jgi:hypothetical protein